MSIQRRSVCVTLIVEIDSDNVEDDDVFQKNLPTDSQIECALQYSTARDALEEALQCDVSLVFKGACTLNAVVEGGVLEDIEGLPEGWDYTVEDHDVEDGVTEEEYEGG